MRATARNYSKPSRSSKLSHSNNVQRGTINSPSVCSPSCSAATTRRQTDRMHTSPMWRGDASRLDLVLPELGLARSRSQAAELISSGRVRVNGIVASKAGARVPSRASIEVDGGDHYVSRAAHKLIAGLDAFKINPVDALALDAGASTGGFTQVLLERGVREVLAIDVGHGQLADSLRTNERVRVVEGCNVRALTPQTLVELTNVEERPELIVADLSFISLELVLAALLSVAAEHAQFVLLIKPQFEVGRQGISGGIVTDVELAIAAVTRVIDFAHSIGLQCRGAIMSPITGEHGNREVLAHFAREDTADRPEWNECIRDLFISGGEV